MGTSQRLDGFLFRLLSSSILTGCLGERANREGLYKSLLWHYALDFQLTPNSIALAQAAVPFGATARARRAG